MGVARGVVVHGSDGLDEITATEKTFACEIKDGELLSYEIDPKELGYDYVDLQDLVGGDKFLNAAITKDVLKGTKNGKRTAVVLNAGMSLYIAGKASSFKEGCELAEEIIDSGKGLSLLNDFVSKSNLLA